MCLARQARDAEVELLLRAIDFDTDGKITMMEYMNSVRQPMSMGQGSCDMQYWQWLDW